MITELKAQNFKSWQDTGTLQFAPLTGLFGTNNSGKTGILQTLQITLESYNEHLLLHLMRQIAEEQIVAGDTVRYCC